MKAAETLTRGMFGGHSLFVPRVVCDEPAFLHRQQGKKLCHFYERDNIRKECVLFPETAQPACRLPSRDAEALCSWKVCPAPGGVITTRQSAPGDKSCYSRLLVTRGSRACVDLQHTRILGTCGSWAHMYLSPAHVYLRYTWISLWHTWISGTCGSLLGTHGSQSPTWTGDLNPWFSVSIVQTQTQLRSLASLPHSLSAKSEPLSEALGFTWGPTPCF